MEAIKACYSAGSVGLLAPLQDFLDDEQVSEILINKPQEVFIEREGTMLRFDIPVLTAPYLRRLFALIANENKQSLSQDRPVLSGTLQDGSRVQLVIPPAVLHETLSVRKFTLKNMSFDEYAGLGFFSKARGVSLDSGALSNEAHEELLRTLYHAANWPEFITQAILFKKNILLSGGTSSGKTTFLNSCIQKIPLSERLITLEDTFEINVPHPNLVRLKTLKEVGEATQQVSMHDLVQASLRLRPDRLIMGEIRGREIFDFVSACSTGHSGALATIHANSPKIAFMRMAQLYKLNPIAGMDEKDIYKILHEVVDVIIQLAKTSEGRRLVEVYYKDAY